MNVGERIKELREKRGLTVNKLANLAGIPKAICEMSNWAIKIPPWKHCLIFVMHSEFH